MKCRGVIENRPNDSYNLFIPEKKMAIVSGRAADIIRRLSDVRSPYKICSAWDYKANTD